MLTLIGKTLIDMDRVVCVTRGNEIVLDGVNGRVVLSAEEADELRASYRRQPKPDREPLTALGKLDPHCSLGGQPSS